MENKESYNEGVGTFSAPAESLGKADMVGTKKHIQCHRLPPLDLFDPEHNEDLK
jgi:hypothetical protein